MVLFYHRNPKSHTRTLQSDNRPKPFDRSQKQDYLQHVLSGILKYWFASVDSSYLNLFICYNSFIAIAFGFKFIFLDAIGVIPMKDMISFLGNSFAPVISDPLPFAHMIQEQRTKKSHRRAIFCPNVCYQPCKDYRQSDQYARWNPVNQFS